MQNQEKLFGAIGMVSDKLDQLIALLPNKLPASLELIPTLKLIVVCLLITVAVGIFVRLILGKSSSLNRAISTAMGILAIYAATAVIHTLNPWRIAGYLSTLPFIYFGNDCLIVVPFSTTPLFALCGHILSLVILSFLVNLTDSILPQGRTVFAWFLLRILSVLFAAALNAFTTWSLESFLPSVLTEYAPAILLAVLIAFLLLGVFKAITNLLLIAVNPFFGTIYSFFFSNMVGKQLSKAVLSTAIMCGFFYFLDYIDFTIISITSAALLSYIPLAAAFLLLWFLLGNKL